MSHRHEAGRNPRVVLVFPPFFWTNQVYMSLPVLAGVLQQQGIPFELRDLNLEFRERLVNPAFLGKMLSEGALLRIAEDSSAPKTRRQAAAASHLALPYVIRHIDEAMDVVKIGRSCLSIEEMEKLEAGVMLMDYAFRIASIPFWPLRLDVACGHGEVLIDLKQIAANIDEDTAPKVYGEFFNGVVSGLASWEDVALFGISVASHRQLHAAYILASVVKDRYPHMPVALGGALTPYMEHMIQGCPDEAFRWIDYYVVGEGDTALCRLYDHVVRQEPLNRVPNLFHRESGSEVEQTFAYTENVNPLPSPNYEGLSLKSYEHGFSGDLIAARGCYWDRCAFCSLCSNVRHSYRERDIDLVMDDLEDLIRTVRRSGSELKTLSFLDESISPSRLDEICGALERRGYAGRFSIQILARFDPQWSRQVFNRAARAGVHWISWGLESGSRETLRLMRKGTTPSSIANGLKLAHEAGIWNHVFIMWYFPGDTEAGLRDTFKLVHDNGEYIDSWAEGDFVLEPGCHVYEHPEKYGIQLAALAPDQLATDCAYTSVQGKAERERMAGMIKRFRLHGLPPHVRGVEATYLSANSVQLAMKEREGDKKPIRDLATRKHHDIRKILKLCKNLRGRSMKVAPNIRIEEREPMAVLDGHNVVVFNDNSRSLLVCNRAMMAVIEQCRDGATLESIVERMTSGTDGRPDVVYRDVNKALKALVRGRYLVADEPSGANPPSCSALRTA